MPGPMWSSLAEIREVIDRKRCILVDLDGVVYTGAVLLPGAREAIDIFRDGKKTVLFLSNNSGRSYQSLITKLSNFGIDCGMAELMSSGRAAAVLLANRKLDQDRGVFVVGTMELKNELSELGVTLADPERCGAVLVGLDPDFSYQTISRALKALRRGVPLIACNRDPYYPVQGGEILPGCGAMIGAIEGASGRKAGIEIGKPNRYMVDLLLSGSHCALQDCLLVGDTLSSDIRMANELGISSAWLRYTDVSQYEIESQPWEPTVIVQSLEQIARSMCE